MRIFVSRRAIHRHQARAMGAFFLAMGVLALIAAVMLVLGAGGSAWVSR